LPLDPKLECVGLGGSVEFSANLRERRIERRLHPRRGTLRAVAVTQVTGAVRHGRLNRHEV
jgi:hypothetical protein